MNPQKEKHYVNALTAITEQPESERRLGVGIAWAYFDDPKRLAFTFSRYKFAAKMLEGSSHILEVGCGDGFASRILRQTAKEVTGVDVDNDFIDDANSRLSEKWDITFKLHDLVTQGPVMGEFDSAVCLDVLEHIALQNHSVFLDNLVKSISNKGAVIIGCPSLESQEWASPQSKLGHISCMTQSKFRKTLLNHFKHAFMFSMNDEVIHTGYSKMSHYNLAVCTL